MSLQVPLTTLQSSTCNISNAEAALTMGYPKAIMGNLNTALLGEVPLFTAHQRENDLMAGKILTELMLEAEKQRYETAKKMAMENARKSFTI